MRLVDFQIHAGASTGPLDECTTYDRCTFPIYEAIRLWLKERSIEAPFRKILITLVARSDDGPWHGHVTNVLNICEATEAVAITELREQITSPKWIIERVKSGLGHIRIETHWRDEELMTFVAELSGTKFPYRHTFERLRRSHRARRVACDLIMQLDAGSTDLIARFSGRSGVSREVLIKHVAEPLFLEDDFPVKRARIVDDAYSLQAADGTVLASVPIPTLS